MHSLSQGTSNKAQTETPPSRAPSDSKYGSMGWELSSQVLESAWRSQSQLKVPRVCSQVPESTPRSQSQLPGPRVSSQVPGSVCRSQSLLPGPRVTSRVLKSALRSQSPLPGPQVSSQVPEAAPRSQRQLDPNAHPDSALCPGPQLPQVQGIHIEWPCPWDDITHVHTA